jgi:ABC-2 type transport system permease protein
MNSPIADLSYRHYDGPMQGVHFRWWAIAKMHIRLNLKKKGIWWPAILSFLGYLILSVIYYFLDSTAQTASSFGRQSQEFNLLERLVWKEQVYLAFSWAQLWIFIIALIVGAGSIANDNRANALLVYLSKPVTKFDYIFGKWLGMAIMLLVATGVPALGFLAFTWLSYRHYGVWDSMLLFKVLLLVPIPAIIHSSMLLGLSSMFNQARVAGAAYAGVYFISNFIGGIAAGLRMASHDTGSDGLLNIAYLSVSGIIEGLSKVILGTDGTTGFAPRRAERDFVLQAPSGLFVTIAFILVCAIFIGIAWRKVRAVEVVGS